MKSANRKLFALLLGMLLLLLAGCGKKEATELPRFGFQRKSLESLTITATAEDFPLLEECINLKYLDFAGSTCYDEILDYVNRHPNVEVVYCAPLGSMPVLFNHETEATLMADSYTADSLSRELQYLPSLKNLYLPKTSLTMDEITALQEQYPDLAIEYSADLLGKEYTVDTAQADLADMTASDVDPVVRGLSLLPALTDVTLPQRLTMEDVKSLMEQAPHITFHYTFDLFGKTLSTTDEKVEYVQADIGNSGEDKIRAALDILPKCTYFKLDNCGIDYEILASIRDDYPDTKVVWRVSFGGQYSLLTDETTLRTVYGVENSHNDVLKYCTGVKYIDMGHNTTLTDISFASYMPDLEILILSGASIQNVDALANCKNLVFLEMANCYSLEDISGLKNCEKLRFLNIGFSKVTDLTPIEDLPLERFIYLGPKIDYETRLAFEESHPDCWVRFTGSNPLSLGWKYDDIGITYSEYYKFIREVFQLDAVDKRLAQQAAAEEERQWQEEQKKQDKEESKGSTSKPKPKPETTPESKPEVKPDPAPAPEPKPEPTPDPAPEPDPAPAPDDTAEE